MAAHKLTTAQKLAIQYYRTRLRVMNAVSPSWAAAKALNVFTTPFPDGKIKESHLFKKAERLALVSDGKKLVGYKWTAPESQGKSLLIVHGFAGNCRRFERYIRPALAKGYDVYAYDAPGHGRSSGKRLNTLEYQRAIELMIATHGLFDTYISHSLGGMALMLALERVAPTESPKVVLIAPATETLTAANNFFGLLQLPNTLREAFDELVKVVSGNPLEFFSLSRLLPFTPAKILWVHDEDDLTTPIEDVYPIVKMNLPNIEFFFTKGLGHSRIYKNIDVKRLIVDFL